MQSSFDINGRVWPREGDEFFYSRHGFETQKRLKKAMELSADPEYEKTRYLSSLHLSAATGKTVESIMDNFDNEAAGYYKRPMTIEEVYKEANEFYKENYIGYNNSTAENVGRTAMGGVVEGGMDMAQGSLTQVGTVFEYAKNIELTAFELREYAGRKNRMRELADEPGQLFIGPVEIYEDMPHWNYMTDEAKAEFKELNEELKGFHQFSREQVSARLENNILIKWADKIGDEKKAFKEWNDIDPEFRNSFIGQVTYGLGRLGVLIPATMVPYLGVIAIESTLFQEAVDDYYASGGTDRQEAFSVGMAYAIPGTAFELAGLNTIAGKLFKGVPLNGKLTMGEIAKRALKEGSKGALVEGPTETLQGMLLDLIAKESYDEGREVLFTRDAFERRLMDFAVGATVGQIGGTTTSGVLTVMEDNQRNKLFRTSVGNKLFTQQDFKEARSRLTDDFVRKTQPADVAELFIDAMDEAAGKTESRDAQAKYNLRINPLGKILEDMEIVLDTGIVKIYKGPKEHYAVYRPTGGLTESLVIPDGSESGQRLLQGIVGLSKFDSQAQGKLLPMAIAGEAIPDIIPTEEGYAVISTKGKVGDFKTQEEALDAAFNNVFQEKHRSDVEVIRAMVKGLQEGQGNRNRLPVVDELDQPAQTMGTVEELETAPNLEDIRNSYRTQYNLDPNADVRIEELANQEIGGRTVKEEFDGVTRWVSHLASGGDITVPIEEMSESYIKTALDLGLVSEEEVMEWHRDWIDFTKKQVYSLNLEGAKEHFGDLVKSSILTDNGGVADAANSQTLRRLIGPTDTFVRKLTAYLKNVLAHAKAFIQYKSEGRVSESLEAHLEAALGLNDALLAEMDKRQASKDIRDQMVKELGLEHFVKIDERARERQESLDSEQSEYDTELSSILKGRIPHPDVLDQRGDPMASDLREVYNNLVTSVTYKKRARPGDKTSPVVSRSTRKNTRAADAFFSRKVNKDLDTIRHELEDDGFYFETVDDMLQSLTQSLSGQEVFPSYSSGETFQLAVNRVEKGFYSGLESVLANKIQGKAASVQQVKGLLTPKHGIKPEEVKWSGIEQWLEDNADAKGKVQTAELMAYLRDAGRVKFEEVTMKDVTADDIPQSYETKRQEEILRERAKERSDEADTDPEDEYDEMVRDAAELQSAMEQAREEYLSGQRGPASLPTLHQGDVLPNGENYREVVLTMPTPDVRPTNEQYESWAKDAFPTVDHFEEDGSPVKLFYAQFMARWDGTSMQQRSRPHEYTSSHFSDIPNYVAHMRLNERTDAAGERGTFIEEIQSDRHQKGRKEGYRGEAVPFPDESSLAIFTRADGTTTIQVKNDAGEPIGLMGMGRTREEAMQRARATWEAEQGSNQSPVPDAPFRKDWSLQMFKRALRDAVASGKSWIGWTTGETQNDRYDLSKQLNAINYEPTETEGFYEIEAFDKSGNEVISEDEVDLKRIEELAGKEIAQKIQNDEGAPMEDRPLREWRSLSGLDLKVGGSGMKGFYDKMLPAAVQKYVKKWGAKVEKASVPATVDGSPVPIWRVDITDAMRESVGLGQTTFQLKKKDADYMEAVESGDMETAQRMVYEAAEKLTEIVIGDQTTYWHYGIRTEDGDYQVGDTLDGESVHWDDGNPTEDGLGGLSATVIGQSDKSVQSAWKTHRGYRGDSSYVLGSDDATSNELGDVGEIILINPKVLAVIKDIEKPVTYDADGNVIPLSQRFDEQKESTTFQLKKDADSMAYEFRNDIKTKNQLSDFEKRIIAEFGQEIQFSNSDGRAVGGRLYGAMSKFTVHGNGVPEVLTEIIVANGLSEAMTIRVIGHEMIHRNLARLDEKTSDKVLSAVKDLVNDKELIAAVRANWKIHGSNKNFGPVMEEILAEHGSRIFGSKFNKAAVSGKIPISSTAMSIFKDLLRLIKFYLKGGNKRGIDDIARDLFDLSNEAIADKYKNQKINIFSSAHNRRANEISVSQRFDETDDRITFQLKKAQELNDAIPDDAGIDPIEELIVAYKGEVMRETAELHRQEEERALAENRIPLTRERGWIADAAMPVSSSIRQYSPGVFARFRKHAMKLGVDIAESINNILPFRKAFKALTKDQKAEVGLLLSNQEHAAARAILRNDEAMDLLLKEIKSLGDKAKAVGFEFDFMRDYFPRLVTDYDGLIESFGKESGDIRKLLYEAESKYGILSEEERLTIINRYLQYGKQGRGDAPSFTKERTINKLTPEQYEKYYANVFDALSAYINRMHTAIANRKFFGKATQWVDIELEVDGVTVVKKQKIKINLEDSVAAFVKLEDLNQFEQKQLKADLGAYFNYQVSPKGVQAFRGAAYITTMGTGISSTMTQFKDIAFAAFEGGLLGAPIEYFSAVFGISETKIERDLGLGDHSQEYKDMISFSNSVDKVFTGTMLKHFGRAGQNTVVNSGINAYRRSAKKGVFTQRQRERLNEFFGNDQKVIAQLKRDLATGKMTEDIQLLGFNILLDYHPVGLTEMPRGYLENPKGRVMYILKTFTIKQFDSYRREGIMEMRRGVREKDFGRFAKGFLRLTQLMAYLWAAGVPVDWLKDFVSNRNPSWSDVMVDNVWQLGGLSRYIQYYGRQHGYDQAVLVGFLPPMPWLTYPLRDADDFLTEDDFSVKDMYTWKIGPFVGQFYYWHFGGGREKMEKERDRETKKSKKSSL